MRCIRFSSTWPLARRWPWREESPRLSRSPTSSNFDPSLDQPPVELSASPADGEDGELAYKGRIARTTFQTTPSSGVYQTVLIVTYADSVGPPVWTWNGQTYGARDLFVTRSLDDGLTWSAPVNLTQTAGLTSIAADPDGAGPLAPQAYHGSVEKPAMVASGKQIVISYPSNYCPGGAQKVTVFRDGADVETRELPYSCMYAIRSADAGATWSAPQPLTDGSRTP